MDENWNELQDAGPHEIRVPGAPRKRQPVPGAGMLAHQVRGLAAQVDHLAAIVEKERRANRSARIVVALMIVPFVGWVASWLAAFFNTIADAGM